MSTTPQQANIIFGPAPNDGLGDPIRTAFIKTQNNISNLFAFYSNTVPSTLVGQSTDFPGMYASDQNYYYYCYGVYDGTSNIWAVVPNITNITSLNNGSSNIVLGTPGGNATVSIGGVSNVAIFTTSGLVVPGSFNTGTLTTGNATAANVIASALYLPGGANTAATTGDTVVSRDANGSFSGNVITVATLAGGNISGNGFGLTNIPASAISGNLPSANTSVTVSGNAQPNITSVGNLTGLTLTGQLISTVGNGTAPFVLSSNTLVQNLNANLLNGASNTSANVINTIVSRDGSGSFSVGNISFGTMSISDNLISSTGSPIYIDPTGDGNVAGTLVVLGNLQVTGNITAINSNVITIDSLLYTAANNAANSSQANGGGLQVGPYTAPYATWTFNSVTNTWNSNIGVVAGGASSITGNLTVSGNANISSLGVGTAASGVLGEIRAANNITAFYSSDSRFKENIVDISNAIGTVQAIGGKFFEWTDEYIQSHGGNDGYFVTKSDFGVIAQDVQRAFPQAVRVRSDGSLAVDYAKLSALAFAAIRELNDKFSKDITELRAEIAKLRGE